MNEGDIRQIKNVTLALLRESKSLDEAKGKLEAFFEKMHERIQVQKLAVTQ